MKSLQDILNTDVEILLTGGQLPHKKLALLCAQLAITLKAGLPLVTALELTAGNQTDHTVRQLLLAVAVKVRSGQSLSTALESHRDQLPRAFLASVRAGEAAGDLGNTFAMLQHHYERAASQSAQVRSALAYPALLSAVAVGVILVILLFAVPVFEKNFLHIGSQLPLPTRILIEASRFLSQHLFALTAGAAALAMALVLFRKTLPGQQIAGFLSLRMPILGRVLQMRAAARFAATLHTLLSGGVALADAARVASDVVENPRIRQEILTACHGILAGQPLSQGLQHSRALPKLLVTLIAVGEETGNLEETLQVVGDYYTRELESAVKTALSLLEPCLTLLLAMVVVFILLAVYLPLFSMYRFV